MLAMSSLSPLFRFYTLPLLVFTIGCLLSWAVFEYQYIQENKQFQEEYHFRAGGHTAAFNLGLEGISSDARHLARFLTHEANSDDGGAFKSNKEFTDFIQMFFLESDEIRDVIWYESEDAISSSLLDSPENRVLHVLHPDSPWHTQSISSVPAIMSILKEVIQEQQTRTFVLLKAANQPWMYEVMSIVGPDGKRGCLLVAWDIGALIERVLSKVPVGGQDIRYDFGKAITLKASLEAAATEYKTHKEEYIHLSRSRQVDEAADDQRRFFWEDELRVFGRTWHVRYDSAPAFLKSHSVVNAWNVFYGGLLMSALLALLTLLIYRRTRVIQALVHMKTQQLNDAQKRVHLLVDSLAEGLFDMDEQGTCTFINQRALDLLGYQHANQVVGQDVHKLIHHSDADGNVMLQNHCKIAAVMQTGEAIHVDNEVFWKANGSMLPVAYRATPVCDEKGKIMGIVVTFLDISAQLVAEQEREHMRKQVEHTQRLESLGVLAGGIAHDFNNLLSTIMGNASLALNHLGDAPAVIKYMQRINKACSRAADLCQQMLAYSGHGQVKKDSLNLSELVQDMGQLLEVSLTKGVELDFRLADPIRLIHADVARIQQVVMNLLTNANEAMSDKQGKIRLTTGVMDVNEDFLQGCHANANVEPGAYVFFEVHDYGCGMDAATNERMFEPFFTTKFTGRGLGMSAVLGIVRAHDGAVKIDSVVGKGTCMRILFPALEVESSLLPHHQESLDSMKTDIKQYDGLVLVVDDEESLREIAGMMLEDMGYQVLFAEDGLQALDVFAQHIDDIDLVLLDLTMPKMGGEACMQALQKLRADVPILISSGYSEVQCEKFENFLPKPYSETLFQEKINAALQK